MALCEVAVSRPQRWDVPFGDTMSDRDVEALLEIEPFCSIGPDDFAPNLSLRGILRNDARITHYQPGDIIVREGDYGHSAFLILKGTARIVLEGLSAVELGRQPTVQRSWWDALSQLWQNPRLPEVRCQSPTKGRFQVATHGAAGNLAKTRVFLQDIPRVIDETRTAILYSGEFFGELAAMTRSQRSSTIFAESDAVLLELRWQGLRDLMRGTNALREHIEQLYRENSLRVHLRETPLFDSLPMEQLDAVAEATLFETHGAFDWHTNFEPVVRRSTADAIVTEPLIAEEGGPCDSVILIRSGFARLSYHHGHGHQTVSYLGKGQVYGLAEAIESIQSGRSVPLVHSLRALGYVDVLRVPLDVLAQHVVPRAPKQLVIETLRRSQLEYPPPGGSVVSKGDSAGNHGGLEPSVETPLLEFLVERRLINGKQAMLIDLDRCTRCDDCIRACAATHDNNPRMQRHGPRHGKYMVAHACMHCVDPVCMIGCPTGAIGRDADTGSVRINDQTCIGCGTCANSCPYDNARMVEIRDSQGAIVVDQQTQQPIVKATKCDLCADQLGGPACQRACPHDALVRMDLGNLGELSKWVSR